MQTQTHRHVRSVALVAALLLAPLAVACGVDAKDGESVTVGEVAPDTTTTAPCVEAGDDDPDTGGAVGGGDDLPTCGSDPAPEKTTTTGADDPDETTTTTGSDEEGPDQQAYVDSLSRELGSDDTFGDLGSDQAECIAENWIDILDPQVLQDSGISPQDVVTGDIDEALADIIDDDIAADLIGSLGGCDVDVDEILAEELRSGDDVPADKVDCLIAALPDGYVEQLLAISLAGGRDALDDDPSLQEPLVDAAAQCQ
ncbi:hypothetical protein BH10ACT1_BH10ACT1_20480 [soil metagenome]